MVLLIWWKEEEGEGWVGVDPYLYIKHAIESFVLASLHMEDAERLILRFWSLFTFLFSP